MQNDLIPEQPDQASLEAAIAPRLRGVNLYLIGMMGCGKTTVGKMLAQKLGYRFFDTDATLEHAAGQTVSEIFAQSGEAAFRQLETQVLAELAAYPRLAIATGGGIILNPKNWSYLHHGLVVWLDVPLEQLYYRLKNSTTRPLLQDPNPRQRIYDLLEQRLPLYAQADVQVHLRGRESPEMTAIRTLEAIAQVIKQEQEEKTED